MAALNNVMSSKFWICETTAASAFLVNILCIKKRYSRVEWRRACVPLRAGCIFLLTFQKHLKKRLLSKHTDMSKFRWLPVSPLSGLTRGTIESPWNMIRAGGAIEFRPRINCFADTYKIWNSTISKTCLHTHSPNPRLKHSRSLTIIPTPTHAPSQSALQSWNWYCHYNL